ncbi:hypothetical protein MNBD_GAMMA14-760 [hydrothermal vent metagenome]|uniref:Uncharacterized protein n=1 Tax=hydrothermal vent metagenome TaxID=652676 RepID=A0A3B0YCD9_9ZZZZ
MKMSIMMMDVRQLAEGVEFPSLKDPDMGRGIYPEVEG